MVRKYLVFISAFFVIFIVAGAGLIWWNGSVSAPSKSADEKRFVITKGASANEIGRDLKEEGLIKSDLAFKFYTQINDISGKIPPGEFSVPSNLGLEDLIALLLEGPTELWVTIPEGLRREEVAEKIVTQLGLSGTDAANFKDEFLALTRGQEGYLFPDTYLFPREATPQAVVNKLTSTFENKFSYAGDGSVSRKEAVVLASIVERETVTAEERPVVAGILLNRINAGWPLQADATVQYAIASERCSVNSDQCVWWVPPMRSELDIDSSYNTYKIAGLPPSPISNPGLSSLNAAVNPTESDYMYYLHDKNKGIHYAKTLEEHNANVARYIR